MVDKLFAQKKDSRQVWTADGQRLVVTKLVMSGNSLVRTVGNRVQIAFGDKKLKNVAAAQRKQLEKVGLQVGKRAFFETTASEEIAPGTQIAVESVLSAGDVVKISGTSKGKGFAGVIKRHGFHGGPRTHGQSDRERAPGSIGQRTTPGRVFPGMRMAGRMGGDTKTLETASVVAVDPASQTVWIKGTLPGSYNSLITVAKVKSAQPVELNQVSRGLLNLAEPVEAPVEEVATETETV